MSVPQTEYLSKALSLSLAYSHSGPSSSKDLTRTLTFFQPLSHTHRHKIKILYPACIRTELLSRC